MQVKRVKQNVENMQPSPTAPSRLKLNNNGIDTAEHGWEGPVERHGLAHDVMPGYLLSVSRPDKYLWITLDSSV